MFKILVFVFGLSFVFTSNAFTRKECVIGGTGYGGKANYSTVAEWAIASCKRDNKMVKQCVFNYERSNDIVLPGYAWCVHYKCTKDKPDGSCEKFIVKNNPNNPNNLDN